MDKPHPPGPEHGAEPQPCPQTQPYKVGYRHPPMHTRWKPGQSGNPGGRPRRRPAPIGASAALVRRLAGRISVMVDGAPRRMRVGDALAEAVVRDALAGDPHARRDLLKIDAEEERARAARRQARRDADAQRRAEAAAAQAARQAEEDAKNPDLRIGWSLDQLVSALEAWNLVVRRGDQVFIRQWAAHEGLLNRPAAAEGDPWAWHPLIDQVGERLSEAEINRARTQLGLPEDAEAPPPRGVGVGDGEEEEWDEGGEGHEEENEAPYGPLEDSEPEGALPEADVPTLPPQPPAPQAAAGDWVERLCERGPTTRGGWLGS